MKRFIANRISRAKALARRLKRDVSGVALIELALTFPILTTIGMYGVEISYMSSVNMQVSQLALTMADNASRLQQTNNNTVAPTVTEADITSIMSGAMQQGANIDIQSKGRIILSSLEKDPTTGKQFIHWQRCRGALAVTSAYGNDSNLNGLSGPVLNSMGQGATKITANTGIAVMFVEVIYDYDGLFGTLFVNQTRFRQEAAFIVRDVRDLRASNQPGITGTGGTSSCT
jgi:Flp pilus assembly protein TadG